MCINSLSCDLSLTVTPKRAEESFQLQTEVTWVWEPGQNMFNHFFIQLLLQVALSWVFASNDFYQHSFDWRASGLLDLPGCQLWVRGNFNWSFYHMGISTVLHLLHLSNQLLLLEFALLYLRTVSIFCISDFPWKCCMSPREKYQGLGDVLLLWKITPDDQKVSEWEEHLIDSFKSAI